MAQVTIYGRDSVLPTYREKLSATIHACMIDALKITADKRFHRFIPLAPDNFFYPADRTEFYTVIEISMFAGRTDETKKYLLYQLMEKISAEIGISKQDIEITLFETPPSHWGIRGKTGDELMLNYPVNI
ncbi:tautomerase family protein [Beggiatoa leptomitoformis]|uniref:Tautomerase family protein n=1 Tax=Beggiatoa leptomitoformis TaxID=288004 RepID=A0A2N9YA44_9GAMM|nr:tautomerase family protein [Beggiatoa leptomitoformis]ALG67243.1 tautomerase family protein [Beggiatoa leptomitoformis]AUI67336.1 tautomerase family protein [Beggiatoa leptomitoformis]